MVDKSYMLERPGRPSAAKEYLDQRVIPAAIDLAGEVEAGLERLAVLVRGQKLLVLGAGVVLGLAATRLALRKR